MKKTTNKRDYLPPSLKARVDVCAFLYAADKAEKIAQIAESKGVDTQTASVIYTLAALNHLKKCGAAKSLVDALNQIEERQAGAKRNPIMVTAGQERTSREAAKINRINHAGRTNTFRDGFTVDPKGNAKKTRFFTGWMNNKKHTDPGRKHTVNLGKVLCSLYTRWEERTANETPENDFTTSTVKENLRLFFKEYEANLSDRSKKNLYQIANYRGRAKWITSAKARNDPERKALYKIADNLFYNFPEKDSITRPEFVELVQEYVTPPVKEQETRGE